MTDAEAKVAAIQAHNECHRRWATLSDEQRSGTTFHGWESHLPADRLSTYADVPPHADRRVETVNLPDPDLRALGTLAEWASEPKPCPECGAGKCGNCDGTSWDNSRDQAIDCPCLLAGHPRRTA